jgi:hypothetical protein
MTFVSFAIWMKALRLGVRSPRLAKGARPRRDIAKSLNRVDLAAPPLANNQNSLYHCFANPRDSFVLK